MSTAIATASKSTLDLIHDWDGFTDLPTKCQSDILYKLSAVEQVYHAVQSGTEKKADVIDRLCVERRVSEATIYRQIEAYEKEGEQGLIDKRRFGKHFGLPKPFKDWIKGLADQLQRDDDGEELYRTVIDRLNLWRITRDPQYAIPGYDTPPDNDPKHDHPKSWSKKNILRFRPKKFERVNIKRGEKDSNKYLPQVLTTRVGSAFMARVMTDDQYYDNLLSDGVLALAGVKDAQRPVSFNALDFYTACHLSHHMRLEYKEPDKKLADGTKIKGSKKSLTSAEYQWFLIGILQEIGYRTDHFGTVFVGEWKTAAGWQSKNLATINGLRSLNDALHFVTEGNVSFEKSGLINKPLFAGLYFKPQSTGNFKFKTWIESSFRLLRTYMQALPGNMGSNQRINGPAELYGIKKRVNQHAAAIAEHLDPHTAGLIRQELLDLPKFYQLVCGVYRAINARTDHKLEGWGQCGFTREIWRPAPDSENWFEEHELASIPDPLERQMMIQRINANRDELTRDLKLSPDQARQVCMDRDRHILKKLQDKHVGLLMPWEWSKPVTIGDGHAFSIADPMWPDTEHHYVAQVEDSRGILTTLPHGMKLRVFAKPFGDCRAHVYTEDREYIDTIYPTVRADHFTPERAEAQLKVRAAVKSALSAQQSARMAGIAEHRTEREEHNDRIHKGDFSTAEERKKESYRKGAEKRRNNSDRSAASDAFAALADISEDPDDTPTIKF